MGQVLSSMGVGQTYTQLYLYCTVPHAQWTFKSYKFVLKVVLLIHAEYSSYHCIISNL